MSLPLNHPSRSFGENPYLRACRLQQTDRVPVWFQRQAGRSLPEYRRIRGQGSILRSIEDASLTAEITMQPVRRYGVDAAILFSDIVVPVNAVGFKIDVVPGVGPTAEQPFRSKEDLKRLRPLEPEIDTGYVLDAVRLLVEQLKVPLIGFAGAPFTVASYLIEGQPSRNHARTKSLMHSDPTLWHELMTRLSDISISSMRSQVLAGASAVQLFDSWAGALQPVDYKEHVLPHSRRVFEELADLGVPRAHFGVGTAEILSLMSEAGADVVGADWRVPIDEVRRRVGPKTAVQGNLDPAVCLADWPVVAEQTRRVLRAAGGEPGHIFNLGHGVLPETNPAILEQVVELVHTEGLNPDLLAT
ncbi:MAG: uroporphyrinogen decarboxylase [Actinomycetota bacterium]|nr:uroporphyrinogen decarboxylase [Acidimicrobiaceae bacterium]MCS5675548.1 uroporphyrinogen decarboxylase [Acidimicrobiales bacterium]MED5541509.1 uroporphyrinogen decarboxylase [Actinomycetota bacterium]MEE2806474.1 uroporphyrinogen decarboxylase [Actinomycetota bacterium]